MARISPLPAQLRYLEPVRRYLTKLGPEGVNEGTDLAPIRKVVRERVGGLSDQEARKTLSDDGAELNEWLSARSGRADSLAFLLPFLAMGAEDVLLQEPSELQPKREVQMDLPEDARVTKENGSWSIKWRKALLYLYPTDAEDIERATAHWRAEATRKPLVDGDGVAVTDVSFGEVKGAKRTYMQVWPAPAKRLDYALEVPGGFLTVILEPARGGSDFDETAFEKHFYTLRVIHHTSNGA